MRATCGRRGVACSVQHAEVVTTRVCVLALTTLLIACGENREGEVGRSGGYFEDRGNFGIGDYGRYIVLVVDDSPSVDAEELRQQVRKALRHRLQHELDSVREQFPDPASWHPVDLTLLIARPSAPDSMAL